MPPRHHGAYLDGASQPAMSSDIHGAIQPADDMQHAYRALTPPFESVAMAESVGDTSSETVGDTSSETDSFCSWFAMGGRHLCVCGCNRWANYEMDESYVPTFINALCHQRANIVSGKQQWGLFVGGFSATHSSRVESVLTLNPIVSDLVRSFCKGPDDEFKLCCECNSCLPTWFEAGWICPEFWG